MNGRLVLKLLRHRVDRLTVYRMS